MEKIIYNNLDKKTIIEIINLFEECLNKEIWNEITLSIENEKDNFKKEIKLIKLNTILSKTKKKYIKKENLLNFTIYYYANFIKIYKNLNAKNEDIIQIFEIKKWKKEILSNKLITFPIIISAENKI